MQLKRGKFKFAREQLGQGVILAILGVGVLMASIVIYGSTRQANMAKLAQRFDASQAAFEALAAAAKRVQYMYAVEAACDPSALDNRLSKMDALPDLSVTPSALGLQTGGRANYTIAQPAATTRAVRENRCEAPAPPPDTNNDGCRQFAIPVDEEFFIVTAGEVLRASPGSRTIDCPRDAAVRLSVAVDGNVYFQRFTLTNTCTYAECTFTGGSSASYDSGFLNEAVTNSSTMLTTACGVLGARKFGSMTNATNGLITVADLRWARRFLETGAGEAGETNFLQAGAIPSGQNGSCTTAASSSQCKFQNCIPFMDLNRDGVNNEADLAILEHYLRGYLTSIPVNELP